MNNYSHNFSNLDDSTNESSFVNLSSKYLGFENSRLVQSPNVTKSTLFKTTMIQANPSDSFVGDNDINKTSSNLQQSSIYTQFKIDTNKFIEDTELIELLKSYSFICSEHSHFLKEKLQYLTSSRQKELLNSALSEQEELDKEKYLWDLICKLYMDELDDNSKSNDIDLVEEEQTSFEGVNEQHIARNLEKRNPFLRRIKLIISWLEKIAAESNHLKLIKEKMSAFSEKCFSWEHTLHHLKSLNNLNRKEKVQFSSRDYVNELDPDAPIRQGKPLHDLDQEDEYKMMEYVFSFIRAGDLNTARDFCFKIGQSWRAASFEGFRLFSDENYSRNANTYNDKQQYEIFKNEGNLNRDIWRLMVYKLIKDEHFNQYEKAVYASLAGFINPVIPVCRTYMDFLWIFLKSLYNHIVEKEIREKIQTRDFINIPYDTDEENIFANLHKQSNEITLNKIFDHIRILIENSGNAGLISTNMNENSSNNFSMAMSTQIIKSLKLDAQKPFSIILKHVILSGINGFKTGTNELMDYLKTVLLDDRKNGLLIRFSSHLSLFYRSASFQIRNDTFTQINESYVQYLIENGYKELIAYYLSQLPSELQIKHYSKFLQTISDNKERILLLKLAKERNMNVQAITINIVDNLSKHQQMGQDKAIDSFEGSKQQQQTTLNQTAMLAKTTDLFTFKTGQILNDEDKTRINALEWIVYDPMQRLKLLEYANLTMRYFLLDRQNLEATKTIFTKIPQDTLTIVLTQYNLNQLNQTSNIESNLQMIENLPLTVFNSVKEYLCFKEYIEAINLYNDWFEFYHKEKPIKPISKFDSNGDSAGQEQSFADRMAFDYQMKQYEDSVSRWYSKASMYTEKVKAKFFGVLKFPFGGWMVDVERNDSHFIDEEDESNDDGSSDENLMSEEDNETDAKMNMDGDEQDRNRKSLKNSRGQRKNFLIKLRKLYLPNICFVLLDMLNKMNLNKELIRLSDLIASENYKLYNLFENQQLRCLLNKIADASINLLDSNLDYLGYN